MSDQPNRLLVIGDVMLDRYVHVREKRWTAEEGPIFETLEVHSLPGGAAAVAHVASLLGAFVTLVGVVGDDAAAATLSDAEALRQVQQRWLRVPGRPTTQKDRLVVQNRIVGRVDRETVQELAHNQQDTLLDWIDAAAHDADVILLVDYGKGVFSSRLKWYLAAHFEDAQTPVLVEPGWSREWWEYPTPALLKANSATIPERPEERAEFLERIVYPVLLTHGRYGLTMHVRGQQMAHVPACPAHVVDPTGAGDTVLAALGVTWGKLPLEEALRFAAWAAARQCECLGVLPVDGVSEWRKATA